jgi:micrococcal nuclease
MAQRVSPYYLRDTAARFANRVSTRPYVEAARAAGVAYSYQPETSHNQVIRTAEAVLSERLHNSDSGTSVPSVPQTPTSNDLLNATYDNTPPYSAVGDRCWAKVIKNYDGDSCHIAIIKENRIVRISCRLDGIDTPELRGNSAEEIEAAKIARDTLTQLVDDRLMFVNISDQDKYGRYLITLFDSDDESIALNVNKELVRRGLACEYDGGTKPKFEDWYVSSRVTFPSEPPQ